MRRMRTDKRLPGGLALLICPVVTFYLFDFYTHNPFVTMAVKTQFLNIVFYQLMGLLLFGVFRCVRVALMVQSGLFMLAGLANYYVLRFRAAPIMPWDIYSLGTAVSVADHYSFRPDGRGIAVLLGFLVLLLLESRFAAQISGKRAVRCGVVLAAGVLLWQYSALVQSGEFAREFGLYDKLFTPTVMNRKNGNIVAFLMELEYLDVEKPRSYSREDMRVCCEGGSDSGEWERAVADPDSVRRPNIIVIMDEAFSDLSVLGEFETNQDYMPFLHALSEGAENTITGTLHVSVLGGNTANTEFEFLTGSTMAFLPQGSVPYQQYITAPVPSLASELQKLGYRTIAMHPYNPDGWERSTVYPLLGFGEFLSRSDFDPGDTIRKYISDNACFRKIIQLYQENEKAGGGPLFLFNVTMQNHGGYTESFADFKPDVEVKDVTAPALSAYLSLLKRTDAAFERLIAYFSRAGQDTMIVFFGDHQPSVSVSNPILCKLGMNPEELSIEQQRKRYQVPYVIWANFDIGEAFGQETSANYLALDILERCGIPLPPGFSCLRAIREEYPVISAMEVRDGEGAVVAKEEYTDALFLYQNLQYYLLFDRE